MANPACFRSRSRSRHDQSLREIGRQLEHASTAPVEEHQGFPAHHAIRAPACAVTPRVLVDLPELGRQRGNYFGTFGVSVYSALNAESLHPLSPLTTLLNYGVISSDGVLDVRIIYDHRVMNGATVARALARLEEILNSAMLEEVRALAETPAKAESL